MNQWNILGIAPTTDKKEVKKAYARLLKQTRPDDDAEGYQRLREAFDWATGYCRYMQSQGAQADIEIASDDESVTPAPAGPSIELGESTPSEAIPSDEREVAAQMVANAKKNQTCLAPVDLDDETDSSNYPSVASEPIPAIDKKAQAQQEAYDTALSAVRVVFNAPDISSAMLHFERLMTGQDLMHLQTRRYFENLCLSALIDSRDNDLPYALLNSMAAEFHWFEEQHADQEKARRVGYLETRLNAYRAYTGKLLAATQSRDPAEKRAADILVGEFRPKYFQVLRFFGGHNRKLREMTRYFHGLVENNYCPELKTETFAWWDKHLSRSLFCFWHTVVAVSLTLFLWAAVNPYIPILPPNGLAICLLLSAVVIALSVWGVQTLYLKYYPPVNTWWVGVKSLYTTDIILSAMFVIAITLWRYFPDAPYVGWLPVLALITVLLLFNWQGAFFVLFAVAIYSICYALIDPLGNHQSQASMTWIVGFISHKLFIFSMHKMPPKVHSAIYSHSAWVWCWAGITAVSVSMAYLYLTVLL